MKFDIKKILEIINMLMGLFKALLASKDGSGFEE